MWPQEGSFECRCLHPKMQWGPTRSGHISGRSYTVFHACCEMQMLSHGSVHVFPFSSLIRAPKEVFFPHSPSSFPNNPGTRKSCFGKGRRPRWAEVRKPSMGKRWMLEISSEPNSGGIEHQLPQWLTGKSWHFGYVLIPFLAESWMRRKTASHRKRHLKCMFILSNCHNCIYSVNTACLRLQAQFLPVIVYISFDFIMCHLR